MDGRAVVILYAAAVLTALAFGLNAVSEPQPRPGPTLMGYGCEGASGILYAYEESDFPVCDEIDADISAYYD